MTWVALFIFVSNPFWVLSPINTTSEFEVFLTLFKIAIVKGSNNVASSITINLSFSAFGKKSKLKSNEFIEILSPWISTFTLAKITSFVLSLSTFVVLNSKTWFDVTPFNYSLNVPIQSKNSFLNLSIWISVSELYICENNPFSVKVW